LRGEEEPGKREGFTSDDIHEACASCSLHDEAGPESLIELGISELKSVGFVEERNKRLFLVMRAEHVRTFEKAVDSSRYVIRR